MAGPWSVDPKGMLQEHGRLAYFSIVGPLCLRYCVHKTRLTGSEGEPAACETKGHIMSQNQNAAFFTAQARTYLRELERGDVAAVCALFAPDAQIYSPFLGWMAATPFFEKVIASSGQSTITPIDFCASTE